DAPRHLGDRGTEQVFFRCRQFPGAWPAFIDDLDRVGRHDHRHIAEERVQGQILLFDRARQVQGALTEVERADEALQLVADPGQVAEGYRQRVEEVRVRVGELFPDRQ